MSTNPAHVDEAYDAEYDRCTSDWYDAADEPADLVGRVIELAATASTLAALQLSWVAALRDDAVAAAGGRRGRVNLEIVDRSLRLELAAALRITEHRVGTMLALAERLVHRYPVVLRSLHGADITVEHAEILTAAIDAIEPEHRDAVLNRGLAMAEVEPVGTFRRALKKLVESLRVETLTERHERALEARRVVIETVDDGMGWVHWYGPAVEAHAIHGRLTATAKALAARDGETRTLDQLRADAFGDLLVDGDTTAHPVDARGIRATVVVTVPVLALLSDDPSILQQCEPAVVEGIGPIPLARARELAGGASGWMRVLTHPETGMVLSVGREQYRPPPLLAKLVKWRADRCMAPGCGMPAARCQIDHTIAWTDGGPTSLWNNAPFCQGHHTVKHHGGWIVRQIEGSGGAIEWISPAGRRYVVQPERRVPVFRESVVADPPPF